VGSGENVLIVEDEDEWRGIYERAVGSQGSQHTVKVAKDLASAERLIDAAKFAVAFVDVGLDVSDDRNVDGLRVMQKIRAAGDETSIVVVTGRGGQDVLSITRDAILKYGAYDTVGKSSVSPSDIRKLLEGGLAAYRKAAAPERKGARDALSGKAEPMSWDAQVMRVTGFKGDAGKLYDFLHGLFGPYLPVVPRLESEGAAVDTGSGFVYGDYWSRSIGAAVAVGFGAAASFDQAKGLLFADARVAGQAGAREPARELASHGVKGGVYLMAEYRREEFGGK
jgi:DNA-binding response OmpR family regulator